MKLYDKGQIEEREYPKGMPMVVCSAIKARRCNDCNLIYFTNNKFGEKFKCRNCKE